MDCVDLFSGCGGMSLGFQNAGFNIKAAFDNWQTAVDIYSANFDHPAFKYDLYDAGAVPKIEEYLPSMIIGGPPCQDFSIIGTTFPLAITWVSTSTLFFALPILFSSYF